MSRSIVVAVLGVVACAASVVAQTPPTAHKVVTAESLVWDPGPPVLPKGMSIAVMSGNPAEPGPYTLRAKMPAGYTIPPHWHPTDENLTVLSGEMLVGMGEALDPASMQRMGPGSYTLMSSPMRHYVRARTEVVLQVHGTGPFTITYVNPADDPRTAAPAK
jgi:quercetin dioxygenase-like cupin family protein